MPNFLTRTTVKKILQKFLDSDPDPDDFENLTANSLSKDYISGKIFMNIDQQFYVKLPTDRQNRQRDKPPRTW